jgi:hypothetical protein
MPVAGFILVGLVAAVLAIAGGSWRAERRRRRID